ncbi:histidine kinase [Pedobacter sp. NJ-S-72]
MWHTFLPGTWENRKKKNHALLQQAHLEAQLRILQDQINPHLMFNVLNHIHILMQKNVGLGFCPAG